MPSKRHIIILIHESLASTFIASVLTFCLRPWGFCISFHRLSSFTYRGRQVNNYTLILATRKGSTESSKMPHIVERTGKLGSANMSGTRHIHCVSKKGYHPNTNDSFNNSCPIPLIFGTNIGEQICHRKVVWYTTSPVYCTYLALGNFKTPKIRSSAVNECLELFVFYSSIIFVSHTCLQ